MKKIVALVIAALICVCCFAACSGDKSGTDMDYVKGKGTLVVGVTDFAPMDYLDDNGNWIGFDADLARLFAESLGCKAEFIEIDWDNKVFELNGKQIDCVWNGMTLSDEVLSSMACSKAYCNNKQVLIVKKDVADQYATLDACSGHSFAVESGSSGAAVAVENGLSVTEVSSMANALLEVASGTSDGAVIDSLMAGAMIGDGTAYADLAIAFVFDADEEYGVGFRTGSDLAAALNKFLDESISNGKLMELATKYGTQNAVITK